MRVATLVRKQIIPINRDEAWSFFSSPKNLEKLTPTNVKFEILSEVPDKMFAGQIIIYSLKMFSFFTLRWVTEITHVVEGHFFVDEQRAGPFSLWHHQHQFKEVSGGTEVIDQVTYAIPLGFIGQIAGWIFVKRHVNAIFDYRYNILKTLFYTKEDTNL